MATSKKKARQRAENAILNRVTHWLEARSLASREPVNTARVELASSKLLILSDEYFDLTGHRIPVD